MNYATFVSNAARNAGAFLIRLAHGGLLAAGFVAVAWLTANYLEHDSVGFADTGVIDARAAPLELAARAAPQELPAPESRKETGAVASLSSEMKRVRDYVARRYKVSTQALDPVLAAAEASGRRNGIDPLLIVAVMAIESSFNPFAESHAGAQGLMQVIPRFHKDKIGDGHGEDALFDPLLNVRVGTEVLVEGLRRFGSLQAALQYYGGARSDPKAAYANKVFAMKKRLVVAAGRTNTASNDA
jgi:soluble lytic murein transglycosylase-like protein